MNERIRQLLEQAGVTYTVMPKDTVYEKFGELIVAECIRLCDQVDLAGADDCMDKIRDHFGVEE